MSRTPFSTPFQLFWYWGPVLAYAFLIFFLSSQSTPSQYIPGLLQGISDKILHALEYGLLAILLYRALTHTIDTKWPMTLSIFMALGYGLSDEIHQWFVPQRESDIFDVLADGFGASLLVFAWVFVTEKFHKPTSPLKPKPDFNKSE